VPGDGPYISVVGKRYVLDVEAKRAARLVEEQEEVQRGEQRRQKEMDQASALARLKQNPTPTIQDLLIVLGL